MKAVLIMHPSMYVCIPGTDTIQPQIGSLVRGRVRSTTVYRLPDCISANASPPIVDLATLFLVGVLLPALYTSRDTFTPTQNTSKERQLEIDT